MNHQQEPKDTTEGRPTRERRAYSPPRLTVHGTIAELTGGGVGMLSDIVMLGSQ